MIPHGVYAAGAEFFGSPRRAAVGLAMIQLEGVKAHRTNRRRRFGPRVHVADNQDARVVIERARFTQALVVVLDVDTNR